MSNIDRRKKDNLWYAADEDGKTRLLEHVQIAILQDIRDELKTLNRVMLCHNTTSIPETLRVIAKNTKKPRRKKPVKR